MHLLMMTVRTERATRPLRIDCDLSDQKGPGKSGGQGRSRARSRAPQGHAARLTTGLANRPNEVRDGGQGRSRTSDTRIFSAVLYQLSYLAALGGTQ